MEAFSRLLNRRVAEDQLYKFHWRCSKTRLTHLSFADDLMIFCGNEAESAKTIRLALSEFSYWSGLNPNMSKSHIYFAGNNSDYKTAIIQEFQFQEGSLPVKYLGLPLVTTKFATADCKPLIEALTARIKGWTVRKLSFAGRLQLIKSSLNSKHIYWSTHMILPKKIINKVEQVMRDFLWKGQEQGHGGAKVAWNKVAKPITEGGLGIKGLLEWNKAAISKLIWKILQPRTTSSWAIWAKANLLKGRSFWDIPIPQDCSWTWRKVLTLRNQFRPYFRSVVGNGSEVFLWYDFWLPVGALQVAFGEDQFEETGLHRKTKVSDIIRNDQWNWPWSSSEDLRSIRRIIRTQPVPTRDDLDYLWWVPSMNGEFTIQSSWDIIRTHSDNVEWHNLMWFPGRVPKTSFCLWLAIRERLYTQDRIHNADPSWTCLLCNMQKEDHNHLFFNCNFTWQVWRIVQLDGGINVPKMCWSSLIIKLARDWRNKNLVSTSWKLCLSVTVYNIWYERNTRLHAHKSSDVNTITRKIRETVQLKLSTLSGIKNSAENREIARRWNLPSSIFAS